MGAALHTRGPPNVIFAPSPDGKPQAAGLRHATEGLWCSRGRRPRCLGPFTENPPNPHKASLPLFLLNPRAPDSAAHNPTCRRRILSIVAHGRKTPPARAAPAGRSSTKFASHSTLSTRLSPRPAFAAFPVGA